MGKIPVVIALFAAFAVFAHAQKLDVSINPQKTHQTIDNFTAADAWSGNFVGQYFEESQKDQIAKWLFSQELGADGNPEGIGLSMWRINIGGGTLEQDGADIQPYQRRAESFLTKDGKNYDWGKCSGQQYFMRKAKEYGCDKFLLFSNTPPVQWTKNGKGYMEFKSFASNLKPDCYGKFADYMADVAKHFVSEGFNIAYISPINEPQGDWNTNRQEGSAWWLSEMAKMARELDKSISKSGLENTKILLGESCSYKACIDGIAAKDIMWSKLYEKNCPPEELPISQLKAFFSKDSPHYLGDLKNLHKVWAAHAYGSCHKFTDAIDIRKKLAAEIGKYPIGFIQSEWCMLPRKNILEGFSKDWKSDNFTDMQSALKMARIISLDLTMLQSQGWGYWKGMEVKGDHALVGVYPKTGRLEDGGVARANKMLWALGNFSLFIRPEFKRIDLTGADDIKSVLGSAFISPDGKRIVAVFVNSSFDSVDADINLPPDYKNRISKVSAFKTDERSDLANLRVSSLSKFSFSPRSITTFVYDLN